jgi:hypothetical protein
LASPVKNNWHSTELRNSLWWWLHSRFAFPKEPVFFQPPQRINPAEWRDWREDGMERIAVEWELIRRIDRSAKLAPFYDLGEYVARNLRERTIPSSERYRFSKMITSASSAPGWTDEHFDGWRRNLGMTKDGLRQEYIRLKASHDDAPSVAECLRWIEEQAKRQRISLPTGLTGQHNRPPSWTMVEVLDIAHLVAQPDNPARKLTPAERKMKTIATQKATSVVAKYAEAMADIRRMPGYTQGTAAAHISHYRRVILGDWKPSQTNW